MKSLGVQILCLLVLCVSVQCFLRRVKTPKVPVPEGDNPGKPLFLTPYIEAGKIKRAQHLSKVKPSIGNLTSYSGYFTTNKKCGNNLFFWFIPAQNDWETAPVVLWLQGGPGGSSLFGLFQELGPFNSFPEGLQTRNYSWNVKNNLLFVDQPVGTGYSFTKKGCYAENETVVGEDLYLALIQFLKLFPNLQKNNFYITGESFGGHFVPAIGHTILKHNSTADLKINLKGMMIGDGWIDPVSQIHYGDYLYEAGLIGINQLEEFHNYESLFVNQVEAQQWMDAFNSWNSILTLFMEYSGVDLYNYLPQPPDQSNWANFVQLTSTRKAIHVGKMEFDDLSDEVYNHHIKDLVRSVKPWVEKLLVHYPIVFYAGQVDVICGYPMLINFLRSLDWEYQELYLNATRTIWDEPDGVAGYITGEYNLFDVLVRDAGHMVPSDQPFWAYELVNSFTHGTGVFSKVGKGHK